MDHFKNHYCVWVVENLSRGNIVLWAKSALEKGEHFNVVDDQFRSPTLAEDLAMLCILSFKKKNMVYLTLQVEI